jgi:hypothetical protein
MRLEQSLMERSPECRSKYQDIPASLGLLAMRLELSLTE